MTPPVADFYNSIRQWCHPEFPFLDSQYSPGSYMPAVDMTIFVAQCIANNKNDAIMDLMSYLTPASDSSRKLLADALLKRIPDWILLSVSAREELQAIHLLLVRMSCTSINYSERTAGMVAATTLASQQLSVSDGHYDTLLKYTKTEAKELGGDAESALMTAMSPLGVEVACANKIKSAVPMARLVVADYVARDWGVGKLRPCLYYGERMYGCGGQDNINNIERLGFFDQPNDAMKPSSEITKEHLRESLEQSGLTVKKSASRQQMIEIAQTIPGLMASLITKITPEQKGLRPEHEESVRAWARRVKTIEPVALALLKVTAIT